MGPQASDGNAGFRQNQLKPDCAVRPPRTGVEIEGFDKLDDVVISHAALCRIGAWLSVCLDRADSKCRGLIAKSIADNSRATRFYLCDDRIAPFLIRAAPYGLPPIVMRDGAFGAFTAPGWEHCWCSSRMVLAPASAPWSAACASWASRDPRISRSTTTCSAGRMEQSRIADAADDHPRQVLASGP